MTRIAVAAVLTAVIVGCSWLGPAAEYAPVAVRLTETVAEMVKRYERSKDLAARQYNCESEWHPDERRLLMLCDIQFNEAEVE